MVHILWGGFCIIHTWINTWIDTQMLTERGQHLMDVTSFYSQNTPTSFILPMRNLKYPYVNLPEARLLRKGSRNMSDWFYGECHEEM